MHPFETLKNPRFSKPRFSKERWQRQGKSFLTFSLPLALVLYFIYHAIQGNHGILAWLQVEENLKIMEQERDKVQALHHQLEHRVRLLRPETLDPDMVEERVRAVLNLVKKEEVVVFK